MAPGDVDHFGTAQQRGQSTLLGAPRAAALAVLRSSPLGGAVLGADQLDEAAALAAGRAALGPAAGARPARPRACARERSQAGGRTAERGVPSAVSDPSPGAVAVLDPLALRARRVRALFVCGLQEGVFPARSHL